MKRVKHFFSYFSFFNNKVMIPILTICLFMCLLNVSTGYQEVLEKQEQEMIKESSDLKIEYYNDESKITEEKTEAAASLLEKCLKQGPDTTKLEESLKIKIHSLNDLFSESSEYFSFLYKDIYTGFTVSYNEKTPIFTASTIKAPAMIYLYEQASKGLVNLEEELTYTSNFYSGGSGALKNKEVGTSYTVKQLIEYTIHDSDNIAYAMLMNRYKRENILPFWTNLGTQSIFTLNTIWGVTSAYDASIYMSELYRFYLENEEYGVPLMNYFKDAGWKMIKNKDGNFNTANKGGWSGKAFHDVAIVFEKNPYILVIMSNTGEGNYLSLFNRTSKLAGELHEEYWKYKENICSKIEQY